MWTEGVPVELGAKEQLSKTAQLPFIFKHIAVMPDVHVGKGSTIGSVIPTIGAIIPAAVGVDIGCGMIAVQTSLMATELPGFQKLIDKYPHLEKTNNYRHLGTLGTGNHFIEICLDEADRVWIMLHSGSRGVGNAIGRFFIEMARKDMEVHIKNLPDRDLAYLEEGTEHFQDYVDAVHWAQEFARLNREAMMTNVILAMRKIITKPFTTHMSAINCHHNYVQKEHHFGEEIFVTRKGAVSARKGELGIIPGSMGAKSYIVRGLGNEESFCSCSHGAGRVMSRTEAKKKFTIADQIKATAHVECRKDANVIDEIPMAYKDIDAVMTAQNELVEIVHQLRQVLCVKG